MKALIHSLIILIFSSICSSYAADLSLPEKLLSAGIRAKHLDVLIEKSEYRLTLLYKNTKIKSYSAVFGFDPTNDKRYQGDGCTPEGSFRIRTKYPHKEWSKFIWIDYPNADSWKKFNSRKAKGEIPAGSKIGGDIGIHGVPKGADGAIERKQNWTLGCISLTRADIDEIYPYITTNSLIEIRH